MTNRYKILISGCGSAGRNVAKVATTDGRSEIVGLVDPHQTTPNTPLVLNRRS